MQMSIRKGIGSRTQRVVEVPLSTGYGDFTAVGYNDINTGTEQLALLHGEVPCGEPVLTRVHSECLTGDVFISSLCECGPQLAAALRAVVEEGTGVVIYMRGHEGRGIGLLNKLKACKLQIEEGLDTVDANLVLGLPVDARDYRVPAEILHDLGVLSVRLMSNNPLKTAGLERHGITVAEQVPLLINPGPGNLRYLQAKRTRLSHHLPQLDNIPDLSSQRSGNLLGAQNDVAAANLGLR
jgi:3,4-dihydroxy 2-butanone 4-phosphate synthase / GTP cyclohydrolase II